MPKKVSHLDTDMMEQDNAKRTELDLPDGGRIISYHPFKSMQIIFFDVHSSYLPDLWKLGFRKGDEGRYLRTLICKRGSCCKCQVKMSKNAHLKCTIFSGHQSSESSKIFLSLIR